VGQAIAVRGLSPKPNGPRNCFSTCRLLLQYKCRRQKTIVRATVTQPLPCIPGISRKMAFFPFVADPSLFNPRPRAGSARKADPESLRLSVPLGRHERPHPDLYARLGIDRRRHELVAGSRHDTARERLRERRRSCRRCFVSDRVDAHAAQRSRGHEIRNSVSGSGALVVRRARRRRKTAGVSRASLQLSGK
jgi:hypothetical protein